MGDFLSQNLDVEQLPGRENFVRLKNIPSKALAAGHCYIQDPSTAAACVFLIRSRAKECSMLARRPAGKQRYLAEMMKNNGFILACDRDAGRIRTLQDNLERLGVGIAQNACNTTGPAERPLNDDAFDRILVDAPCSNTGVMRRRVDVRWRLTAERLPAHAGGAASHLARDRFRFSRRRGRLVYSTCSLEPEENEDVVRLITEEFPFLKLLELVSLLPFRDGFDGAFAAKLMRAA